MAKTRCIQACSHGLLKFTLSIRMGKGKDLSHLKCGVIVGATQVCLNISETTDLL